MTFRDFLENLWGNIPVTQRKPSDGRNPDYANPSHPSKLGGAPSPAPRMMRKNMRKNMKPE